MNNNSITIKEAAEITTITRINVEAEAEDEIEVEISTQNPNDMRKIKVRMVTSSMTETLKNNFRDAKAVAEEAVVEDEAAVVATLIARIAKTLS